jgi:hypothetical protein
MYFVHIKDKDTLHHDAAKRQYIISAATSFAEGVHHAVAL